MCNKLKQFNFARFPGSNVRQQVTKLISELEPSRRIKRHRSMTRIQTGSGGTIELAGSEPTPPDIRRWELEVLKNVLCIAVFAGLLGYSVASSAQGHNTIMSMIFYIVTALGLMYFIPRLAYSTYKFMTSSATPDYDSLLPENEATYAI